MSRYILAHAQARALALDAVRTAPDGYVLRVEEPGKSGEQRSKYHAMIGDIAKQVDLLGKRQHPDDAKRLLVDAFAMVMREAGTPLHHDGRVSPSLDGLRVVQLGIQTERFYKAEASEFIEYLFAFGAQAGVRWSDNS